MPGSLPWGMILVFFNDFLAQQKHFSVQAATLVHPFPPPPPFCCPHTPAVGGCMRRFASACGNVRSAAEECHSRTLQAALLPDLGRSIFFRSSDSKV